MIVNLKADFYAPEAKSDVKRVRRAGKIPGILYGHKEKSRRVILDKKEFSEVLETLHKEAVTINLQVEKKEYLCVIKSIQHNPVTDELLHIDFQHIHKGEKIKALVPIHLVGEAPGIKQGGMLDVHLHEVRVRCLPADIPSHIDVDVSSLDLGNTIHLSEIHVPKVDFDTKTDTAIVSVLIPRAIVAEVKVEEKIPSEEEVGEEAKEEAEKEEKKEEDAQGSSDKQERAK